MTHHDPRAQRGAVRTLVLLLGLTSLLVLFVLAFGDDDVRSPPEPLGPRVVPRDDPVFARRAAVAPPSSSALQPEALATLVGVQPDDAWAAHGLQTAAFSGRVVDKTGAPLARAVITWLADADTRRAVERTRDASLPVARTTRSDDAGCFTLQAPWRPRDLDALRDADWDVPRVVVGADGFAWRAVVAAGYLGGAHDFGDVVLTSGETRVRVRVVNPSGAPVEGVEVEVGVARGRHGELGHWQLVKHMWTREQRLTDAHGELELGVPEASAVRVTLRPPEHPERKLGDLDIERGVLNDLGSHALPDGLTLAGRVIDARGHGLAGARLELRNAGDVIIPPLEQQGRVRVAWAGVTGADGGFEVRGLPESEPELVISVSRSGFVPLIDHAVTSGLTDLALRLDDATPLRVELRSAADDAPLPDAKLFARVVDAPPPDELAPHAQGLPVEVRDGELTRVGTHATWLYASAAGHLPLRVELTSAELDDGPLVLRLEPGPAVTGVVVDAAGKPLAGAVVHMIHGDGHPYRDTSPEFGEQRFETDAEGRFRADALPFGTWTPRVSHARHWTERLEPVSASAPPEPLRVVLAASAEVRGVLLASDGTPAAGRTLSFRYVEDDDPSTGFRARAGEGERGRAVTDVSGRFQLAGLRGGRFSVESWPGLETEVELARGESRAFTLACEPAPRVFGTVSVGGVPRAGARLSVRPIDDSLHSERGSFTSSASDGSYTLELLAEGDHDLTVRVDGGASVTRSFSVRYGEAQQLDIALEGGRLAGVLMLEGEGLRVPDGTTFRLMRGGERVATLDVASDGGFAAEPLEPGAYELHVEHALLPRVWWGPYDLAPGEQRDELKLIVGGAASLGLRLTSPAGERLEGFVSLLDPDSGEALRCDDVDWGAVAFDSLQPGTYRVLHAEFGWPHDADGPLAAAAFAWPPGSLSRVLGADTVTLAAFEQRTLELVVQPGPGAQR